jgi:cardiolipin hydrolase
MKKLLQNLVLFSILLFGFHAQAKLPNVCFSPSNCCEDNVIELLKTSDKTVDIAIYSFTNARILEALKEAKERGLAIRIVTDKTQSKGKHSLIQALIDGGFDVRIKKKYRIEHNKFAVFDNAKVITGSYNWTESATNYNSENCLIEKRITVVKKYSKRFNELWELYEPKVEDMEAIAVNNEKQT